MTSQQQPAPNPGNEPLGIGSISLILLTVVLWGGTPVAISYSVDAFPPIAVAGWRFLLAALFMMVWSRIEGTGLGLQREQIVPCVITGTFLFLQISLFHWGIELSNSSHATLFINTFIFWVAAIEHFLLRTNRLSMTKLVGLLVAAGSVALLLIDTEQPGSPTVPTADRASLLGDMLLLGSGCLLGFKIIYTKHALKKVEPGKLIFWHDVVGVVLFFACSTLVEDVADSTFTMPAFWGLLYQGLIVAGLCFGIQARLLRKHSASQVAVFSFATPLFGILAAVLFRGDVLSPWLFLSGIGVALGIVLVNRTPRAIAASPVAAETAS